MNPQLNIKNVLYKNDYVNPAPNIGLTWNPRVEDGLLAKLLGHNKSVFSAAYRITYYDEGMNAISNVQSGSPGARRASTLLRPSPRTLARIRLAVLRLR